MNTIREYQNRFNQLMESTMGNVKPLLMEKPKPTGTTQTTSVNGKTIAKEMVDFATKQYNNIFKTGNANVDYSGILPIVQKINDQYTYNIFNGEVVNLANMDICRYINSIMADGDKNYKEICDHLSKFQGGKTCFQKSLIPQKRF